MKNVFYRLSVLMLALVLFAFGACTEIPGISQGGNETPGASENPENPENPEGDKGDTEPAKVTAVVDVIAKHGNLKLDIIGSTLLDQGYEYGDILEVTIAGKVYELPLCSNYSDVEAGETVLRAVTADEVVVIAYNMGDFATTEGIATKTVIEEEPGYRWDYLVESPVNVEISLKQKGGYRDQWILRQLTLSMLREDYPHLTDEEFGNFRVIATTGMGKNVLYRSSTPINPEYGRSTYVDKAMRDAGILTVINMADASNTYEGAEDSYYQTCQVAYLNLGMDFLSENVTAGLASGLRFIINNDGPYLIHCNEGKDRAGFVSALLEILMGATLEEVIDDYMVTYYNYYGVEEGTEKYDVIVDNNLIQTLEKNFKVGDAYTADLMAEAVEYLTEELGLSADEVHALKAKLGA